ncbi:MAG: hypothetical protein NVSMB64_21070 [Candidatus Velthaea sp.]
MHDPQTDAIESTRQIRFHRKKILEERRPLESCERDPTAAERVEAIMTDALVDTGGPTTISSFVVGPFRDTAIVENEIFIEGASPNI